MSPQDLMKITIMAESSHDSTDFEDITYKGATVKAKVVFGDFRKIGKTESKKFLRIEDEISFLNVIGFTVTNGIDIVYDGETYYVQTFTQPINGVYNIFCTKKKRVGSR